ncbi:uncharacterized protein [Spinacia oleracea]|uniref:Reverse transcriptase domain-containing protein n=1 Tax=Spinacia oleracea TaxID=3562 RepID=A0A9R0HV15_SPIOL|nr:uncharacterized protein LOC110776087 [Spinacia oleracea]
MKILSWNCQGLGNSWTVNALRDWCWRERPNIVFLMETMIDAGRLERIRNICGFVKGVCLSSDGRSGGMGFWWRDINVATGTYSAHHFIADILDQNNSLAWRAVGIYGWPEQENKHLTWTMMERIKASSSVPCVMFGDFNEILSHSEKDGGPPRCERVMDAFRGAIDGCGLRDLGYKGSIFTWKRGTNPTTYVRERLDRFLADVEWCSAFPNYSVRHFVRYRSDHAPILLSTSNYYERGRNERLFRFEALWLSKPECCEVIAHAWSGSAGEGAASRIARCAESLSEWAASSFGNIKKKIKETERKLRVAQAQSPDSAMISLCNMLSGELDELHKQEESYWYARARANELRDGDKNTGFFHQKASQRKHYNTISGLLDEGDVWRSRREDVEELVASYFGTLFTSEAPYDFEHAMSGMDTLVTQEMNVGLDTEPTDEEIKAALFQMHPNKAPGPDGMHALFFQKFLHIVGGDIIMFVKQWWRGLIDLNEVNKTCVVLIPKCENPKRITEFRPISCCNVLYKIVSKTMANKLKPLLGDIISVNQSAFVPKRLITDNALIAFEIFHAMKRRGEGKDGSVALKLDMKKAYDRVEWLFLEKVMYRLGFSDNWVRRIMDCLSSVSFAFKINGRISGSVTPSRGLRQGDPISPYLFLIVADAFSTLIAKAAREKLIHGVKICNGAPRVSHLFFADDSILFAKATVRECSVIADIISKYERASGQSVNLDKTDVVFSKCVEDNRRQEIVTTLGVKEVERHEKYLGLPTIIGRSKKVIFASIKERIWKKLQGWKEKLLSRPGKEVLIKAVAQAIPTYMMSIFKIPDELLDEIHSIIASFWWGSNGTARKMHWYSWESLCKPKAMGGMGFRDLKVFNQALLAKQMWRLQSDTSSFLHTVLKARYFKHDSVLDARRGFDPSYSWRSLWGSKSLLLEGLKWRVGNGASINVWEDGWIPGKSTAPEPRSLEATGNIATVADCIDHNYRVWDERIVKENFSDNDCKLILQTPLSIFPTIDQMYWSPTKDGVYTVKSGYWVRILGRQQAESNDNIDLWRLVWGLGGPPKLSHFVWQACKGGMAVKEVLFKRHIAQDELCPCCGVEVESINHALLECDTVKVAWETSKYADLVEAAPTGSFASKLQWWASKTGANEVREIMAIAWAIWFCRNKYVHEKETMNVQIKAASFLKLVEDYRTYAKQVFHSSPSNVTHTLSASQWKCPPSGLVKVNIDAHVVEGSYVGLGAVIRDVHGKIIMAAARRLDITWDASIAEAAAARFGLQIAQRFGYNSVWLEGDAINVVKAVENASDGFSPIFLIYDDISRLSKSFDNFIFSHVRRVGNTVAHLVARWDTKGYPELVCSCDGFNSIFNGSGLNHSVAGQEARFSVYLKDAYQSPSPVEIRMLQVQVACVEESYMVLPTVYPLEESNDLQDDD